MNVLVAVASKHGSTREIADVIGDVLRSGGVSVDVEDVGTVVSVDGYDAVVLGSAIYAGRWLPEARSFAERYHSDLLKVPLWLFSSGPLGSQDPQPHDDPQQLAAPLRDIAIRDHCVFVGKLDKGTLSVGERIIATLVKAPEGDFRDWNAVHQWACKIAWTLRPAARALGER